MIGPNPSVSIINWNARHIKNKKTELKKFISDLKLPEILCIQETRLKKNDTFKIHKYEEFRQPESENKSPGLSILVREDINANLIEEKESICINYQTLEISINKVKFQLSNVYLRDPNHNTSKAELTTLLDKKNHIFVGDFNAHSKSWGNNTEDSTGKHIEEITLDTKSTVINTGLPTRLGNIHQSNTAIDLAVVTEKFPYPI